jgi:predicted transposase YbfD/YdcC
MSQQISIQAHFSVLPDPRIDRRRRHELLDILVIALCAGLCGIDDWAGVELFATLKEDWFRTFLKLPGGIPSHDTFGRVFSRLDPKAFEACFRNWIASLAEAATEGVVAIDGKSLRGSFDTASGKSPLHMVSAFSASSGLCLGQVATDAKSNEIIAIPALLQTLGLKGCIVTIDAMGCQKEIARQIVVDAKADYVLALKGNQGTLHQDVRDYFEASTAPWKDAPHSVFEETDKGHGRIEIRKVVATDDLAWLEKSKEWRGLTSIAQVESTRIIGGKETTERRYYISSLPADAAALGRTIRQHWGIENRLHWCLDVTYNDDASRIRKDHAPQNMTVLRRLAVNLLRQIELGPKKISLRGRLIMANHDPTFILRALGF